jgi:hypothetical protein
MKCILGFAVLLFLSSTALLAAKGSQTFYLSTDVRVGNDQISRGICEVTWGEASGSNVQLTIKSEDKKTITVPAHMVEQKQTKSGLTTSVVNGVTYLEELHTTKASFRIQESSAISQK